MRLAKVRLADDEIRIAILQDDETARLLDLAQIESCRNLTDILHAPDPAGRARFLVDRQATPVAMDALTLLAPIDHQEIWAAGVTYKRSQVARMEESETAASHYDRVYTAARPELFFKATPNRVAGPGERVRMRHDSSWSVPEPELTLVITPDQRLAGFTAGNDMSARDIEGENPLYLPQAKFYRQCCSLGPCILLSDQTMDQDATRITLQIERDGSDVFHGETNIGQMARSFDDLISWLFRENEFPNGVLLLTGTGVVPPDEFSLVDGDRVSIEITGIGTLTNHVVRDGV